ncbi:MAG: hypothetical protein ABI347_01250 [Nitrososphaera sp.]
MGGVVSEGYLYDCATKRNALNYALGVFGKDASRLLISQLEDKYKLIIDGSTPCSSLEEIEQALFDIAGPSSDLIIARMHAFLRSSNSSPSTAHTS